jgi:hypothetical protein
MKYIVLGYYDEKQFEATPPEVRKEKFEECLSYDDELRRGGHFLGSEALDPGAVTLRMRNGEVVVTDGPFAETKEILGGFLLLEARDLNHAIVLMSKHPALIKVGHPFEIRPVDEEMNRVVAERAAAVAKKA